MEKMRGAMPSRDAGRMRDAMPMHVMHVMHVFHAYLLRDCLSVTRHPARKTTVGTHTHTHKTGCTCTGTCTCTCTYYMYYRNVVGIPTELSVGTVNVVPVLILKSYCFSRLARLHVDSARAELPYGTCVNLLQSVHTYKQSPIA